MDTSLIGKKRKAADESCCLSDPGEPGVELGLDSHDVIRMLEPLERSAMLDILQRACGQHPELLIEVRRYVDKDPAHRKLFVRGLGWETSTETLKGVFSQYGELEEGVVIRDKATQRSRGFGFVTFKHMDGAIRALKEPSKRIDGRVAVCQFAAWAPSVTQPLEDISARKIYVGNVPVGISADKVLGLFSQFGEIAEGPIGFDKSTGTSKGFALIIYKTSEAARKALLEPYKMIDGQQVHCKLAMEGHKQQQSKPEVDFAGPQYSRGTIMPPVSLSQGPMSQNPPPTTFHPPSLVQVPPPSRTMYNYASAAGLYAAQSAAFYGTSVPPQSGLHPGYGYGGQQLSVPMGPRLQPVGGVPSLPSTYNA